MRLCYMGLAVAALSLAACGPTSVASAGTAAPPGHDPPAVVTSAAAVADAVDVPPPVVIADRTTLDETGARTVGLAYKAARRAVELAVDTGALHGAAAARFRDLNTRAYAAVGAVNAAYFAGNATTYAGAVRSANEAVAALLALAGGDGP